MERPKLASFRSLIPLIIQFQNLIKAKRIKGNIEGNYLEWLGKCAGGASGGR